MIMMEDENGSCLLVAVACKPAESKEEQACNAKKFCPTQTLLWGAHKNMHKAHNNIK